MKQAVLAMVMMMAAVAAPSGQQPSGEEAAVRAAVTDYVEALYKAEPDRIKRSVHPDLAKRGFMRRQGAKEFSGSPMTYQQLLDLAGSWNKDGKRNLSSAPKEIVIYDVSNQTATAKLTAQWGIDYLHLAKYDGTWKIINILWQDHPTR
jgi:hypothetical protein